MTKKYDKSEFDDGRDLRTPLQQAYGAGESDNEVWSGTHPGLAASQLVKVRVEET